MERRLAYRSHGHLRSHPSRENKDTARKRHPAFWYPTLAARTETRLGWGTLTFFFQREAGGLVVDGVVLGGVVVGASPGGTFSTPGTTGAVLMLPEAASVRLMP